VAITLDFRAMLRDAEYEPAAKTALAASIVGLVLIWPFGIVLGPFAVWSGISARYRIQAAGGRLRGLTMAAAAIAIGSVVCALCALGLLAELVSFVSTGSWIPAY
jgi:uncharacterized Tic20 family protein